MLHETPLELPAQLVAKHRQSVAEALNASQAWHKLLVLQQVPFERLKVQLGLAEAGWLVEQGPGRQLVLPSRDFEPAEQVLAVHSLREQTEAEP